MERMENLLLFLGYGCLLSVGLGLLANVSEARKEVGFYELKRGDISLKLTNWGATVVSLVLPDKNGKLDDVVLGYDHIQTYTNDTTYFGAIVGRVANRIGGAHFTVDGIRYRTIANEGKNTLHGGHRGFADVIWTVTSHRKDSHITFTYDSFDGEQGFPGELTVSVTYMFVKRDKLAIKMEAKAHTKATPVNLATHVYWNLAGHASGTILNHTIQLFASEITPVNDQLIPTGKFFAVKGTPYDFLKPRQIGSRIGELSNGYDINYVLDGKGYGWLKKVAVLQESKSGRKLELWANKPGLQFYTGNLLKDVQGKDGAVYPKFSALCLETQGFPDSVNHPNFPSQIVRPGETYKHVMLFKFTAK